MNYKNVLLSLTVLVSVLLIPLALKANEQDSALAKKTYPLSLQTSVNVSYLAPKGGFNESALKSYTTNYYDVRIKWDQNPAMQAGIVYGDFSGIKLKRDKTPYTSKIGHIVGAFVGVDYDFIKAGRWKVGLDLQNGLAYCTSPFDSDNNIDNRMIGSHLNVYINIGLYARYRLSPQWSVALNIDGKHFSNGTVWQPNLGANTIGPTLSVQYDLEPQPLTLSKKTAEKSSLTYEKGYFIDITGALGLKTLRPVFEAAEGNRHSMYAFPALSVAAMKRYHKNHATGIGMDYTYAGYVNRLKTFEHAEGIYGYHYSPHVLGASIRHELYCRSVSLSAGVGYYLFRQAGHYGKKHEGELYQALGVRYTPPIGSKRLYIGYQVRAHNFSRADCINFTLGYRLKI